LKTNLPKMLFLIYLLLPGLVFTQSFEKIIEYDPDYKMLDITSSVNYFCISIDSGNNNYFADVLDKKGTKVFSKNASGYIQFGYVLEPEKYLILITNEYNEIDNIHLMARAYSIENDQLIWKTIFFSGPYELSPNGRMLLNKNQLASEATGPLSILYLNNGQIKSFLHLDNIWSSASWLDNTRLTLVKRVWIENPEFSKYIKEVNRKSELINEEIRSINIAYHNGEIGTKAYKSAKLEKVKELAVLRNSGKKTRHRAIMNENQVNVNQKKRPTRYIQKASRFFIFNIDTKSIETNISLFHKDGKPIIVSYDDIYSDKDGNTYFTTGNNSSVRLLKLDENGKILWSTKSKKGFFRLIKYNMTELIFIFIEANGYSLIDKDSGLFIKEQDIPNNLKQKIQYSNKQFITHTFSNLSFNKTNGKISLLSRSKPRQ
jgi:hypothetical protein